MKHRGMIITVAVVLLATIVGVGAVSGIGAWSSTTAYPASINAQSCVVDSGFVYCIGGLGGCGIGCGVYFASLSPAGGVGAWSLSTAYPTSIYSQSCVANSGFVYCIGGITGTSANTATNSVYFASLSSNGVGSWSLTTAYPTKIEAQSCVVDSGFVYCIAGYNSTAITNSVYFAQLSSNGVGSWSMTTAYPTSIFEQSCVAYSGFVYCVGSSSVYFASLSSNGVGSWSLTTAYPTNPIFDGQGCVVDSGLVYCIGGSIGSIGVTGVYFASLSSSGIGSWSAGTAYPIGDYAQSCVVDSGFVYCIGGGNGVLPTSSVYFASLSTTTLPSTTTTVSCDASVVINQPSNCTATVTDTSSSPTTPTGTVSFTETGLSAGSFSSNPCTLIPGSAGTASCTATFFSTATGEALVNATYTPTDSTHSGSSATSLYGIIVAQRLVSVTVGCNSPVAVNTPSACNVTVADTSPGTAITPAGTFSLGTNSTGSFSGDCILSGTGASSQCALTYTPGVGGTHEITATYPGDTSHVAVQNTFDIMVTAPTLHTTVTGVSCSPSSVVVNQGSTCTATVTDSATGATTPTGTVNFAALSPNGLPDETGTLTPPSCTLAPGSTAGTASCSVSFIEDKVYTVGGRNPYVTISGTYNGDQTQSPSTSPQFSLTINLRSVTTTVSCTPSDVSVSVATTCTVALTDTSPGTTLGFIVSPVFTSTGSGAFSPPYFTSTQGACEIRTTNPTGSCSVDYTPTAIGTGKHTIAVSIFGGDNAYGPSSGSFDVTVNTLIHETTTTVTCSPATVVVQQSSICTATVTDGYTINQSSPPSTPTGTVTFAETNPIGTATFTPSSCTLVPSGTVGTSTCGQVSVVVSGPPFADIQASFGADTSHASSSGLFRVIVNPRPDTTTLSCAPSSISIGQSSTCTFTLTDNGPSPSPGFNSMSVVFSSTGTGTFSSSNPTYPDHCFLSGPGPTASCSVTYTPSAVGTGTHTVTGGGDFGGSGVYAPSSASFDLTVTPGIHSTTTSISCSPANVVVNQPSTCSATVTDTSATGATSPTGVVTFNSDVAGIFDFTSCDLLASTASSASCSVNYSPGGPGPAHVSASYPGDSTHSASNANAAPFTIAVGLRTTSTTISCSSPVILPGTSSCTVTVTDTSLSTPVTPTGVFHLVTNSSGTFTSNDVAGQCVLAGSGAVATCIVVYHPAVAGHHNITATEPNDPSHFGSAGFFIITVATSVLHPTTIAVTCDTPVVLFTSSTCTAIVTDVDSTPTFPTGVVTFTSSNSTVAVIVLGSTCSLSNPTSSTARCEIEFDSLATGIAGFSASYAGDSTHKAASTVTPFIVTVNLRSTTTSISCNTPITANAPSTCTVAVTDTVNINVGLPITPTGSVSLSTSGTGTFSGTCGLSGSGATATCTVTYTPAVIGTHAITANYPGDLSQVTGNPLHAPSSGTFDLSVTAPSLHATTTGLSCNPNPMGLGGTASCTATVSDSVATGATNPSGTVTFSTSGSGAFNPATMMCTLSNSGTNAAACSVSYTPDAVGTGTHDIGASYGGDSAHAASTATAFTLTVNKATPTITSVVSPATITVSGSASDLATVSDGFSPTGTVTYTAYSDSACTVLVFTSATIPLGTPSAAFTPSAVGTYFFTAAYNGDANNNAASTTCGASGETLTVGGLPTPTLTTTLENTAGVPVTSIVVGTAIMDTATITPTAPSTSITGTVTYNGFANGNCAAPGLAEAVKTITNGMVANIGPVILNSTGSFSSDAFYSGDANNAPVTSACETLTVTRATPSLSTHLSSATIIVGGSVTDSASLTRGFQAGGTVTYEFFSGSVCMGTATIVGSPVTVASGVVPVSAAQTFNTAGAFSWNALYSGDANNNGVTGPCEPLMVTSSTGKPVLITFSGFDLDDFDNGVGQLQVFVNGHLAVDIPAGLNHLTGSGDYTPYTNRWINFGPFDITSFVVNGQNNVTFADHDPADHFGLVRNVTILQGSTILLHVQRPVGIYPGYSKTYTFSNPPLLIQSFTASNTSPGPNQQVTFTASFTGGIAPFKCTFDFGDGATMTIASNGGSCSATHSYSHSGVFMVTVTVRSVSVSDVISSRLTVNVA